jgi:hypothetical protein
MSKELYSLYLQILGLIIVALFAWRIKKKREAYSFAICFMFIINLIAQVIIAGEGPGACAGAVVLPLYGVIIAWICVRLSSRKTNNNKQHNCSISIETTRYSTLMKRIFEEYNENIEIHIDGSRYTEKDIPKLLEWWCNNKTIKATVDFTLSRDGVRIFSFHDSPDDFWAAISERLFVEQLAKEKIIRFKLLVD